jgi:hypothetical protein
MVKSRSVERMKRFILVHILLNKEPSFVAGLGQTAFGGNRGRNSCKNILRQRPKTGIPATPSKTTFQSKIPPENTGKKEILRNPVFFCF